MRGGFEIMDDIEGADERSTGKRETAHVGLLDREIPEAKKPRQIPIGSGNGQVIEGKVETKVAA